MSQISQTTGAAFAALFLLSACDGGLFDARERVPVEDNIYWVGSLEGCPAVDVVGGPIAACAVFPQNPDGTPVPGGDCVMYIPAKIYGAALCHEKRHCTEGDWHRGRAVNYWECR